MYKEKNNQKYHKHSYNSHNEHELIENFIIYLMKNLILNKYAL